MIEGNTLGHDDRLVLGLTLGIKNDWKDGDILDYNDDKLDGNGLG